MNESFIKWLNLLFINHSYIDVNHVVCRDRPVGGAREQTLRSCRLSAHVNFFFQSFISPSISFCSLTDCVSHCVCVFVFPLIRCGLIPSSSETILIPSYFQSDDILIHSSIPLVSYFFLSLFSRKTSCEVSDLNQASSLSFKGPTNKYIW